MGGRERPMIDKAYYETRLTIYFGDLLLSTAVFVASFIWCLQARGALLAVAFVICSAAIYRAGAFMHDIAHRQRDPRMKIFNVFWNLTIGAIILSPSARFYKPHLTHHSTGLFGTRNDPQYLLLRSNRKLAVFVLGFIPFLMPLLNLFDTVAASFGTAIEERLDRYLQRYGYTIGADIDERYKPEVRWYSRFALLLFATYAVLMPEILPLMYAVQVGGWALTTWRIPLEHSMRCHVEASDSRDQITDTFTIETPLDAVLQPLGLRFHTAHHMYPGVPYYNLPALHAELKAKDSDYRRTIVSFWDALRGPKPFELRDDKT
jgi:fatty acid desaturase